MDAIVNSTNETITDRSGICGRLFQLAGERLEQEVKALEGCRTGEAKITKAFLLPCTRYIFTIHTNSMLQKIFKFFFHFFWEFF